MTGGGYLVAFIAGITVGFVAGVGVSRHKYDKQLEDQTFDGAKKYMDISDELDKATYTNDRLQRRVDDLESKIKREEAMRAAQEYNPANNADDITLGPREELGPPGPDDDDPDEEPFTITEDDFLYRYPHTQSQAFTYYQGDGMLVDENMDPISSPMDILGEEAMWALENTEDDVIYVHNPKMEMNYEIEIRHNENYIDWNDEEEM